MDQFQGMSVFVAVAEEHGFAAGARRMGLSPPSVTRAIALLEERLGVKLFNRSTRHVRLTDAGERYLESSRRLLAEIAEAEEQVSGVHSEPRGQLRVTAPVLFGSMYITPAIADYLKKYPTVSVSALFVDRLVNLYEEDIDVGIRVGELPDSGLRAVAVGWVRRVMCASPEYLEQQGLPLKLEDLAAHTLVSATPLSVGPEWRLDNKKRGIRAKARLTVNINQPAIEAALQDLGITQLLSYQVAEHLESGRLIRILAEHEPPPIPIHVIYREVRQASGKVRSFVDLLVEKLRNDAALEKE